jgi:superfamily II DNA/RNA helicase
VPTTFADLGVPAPLCDRLAELGIAEPFPVQAATLPDALAGRDVCGKAPTGSGKTIAFGLPLLARVGKAAPRRPRALVLVPTRELAAQVEDQLSQLSAGGPTRIVAIYGGAGMQQQIRALQRGVEVVVATPGRLKDLLDRGSLRLDDVEIAVVDEADRMADMGFLPEVRRLLDKVRDDRQTLLFSATLDGDVDVLVKGYQRNPARHEAVSLEVQGEVTHRFWSVAHGDRVAVATAIVERSFPAIVFTRTKHGADRLAKQLTKAGVPSVAIHGDRSQSQRERALDDFGRGRSTVLVATDVAARGIHVDGVACVLQFDPPAVDKDYVHRSGRTGRAGAHGTVITLVTPEKAADVRKLQRELRRREPIEAATAATASAVLASTAPKPIDRGDGLDGVSRRERARAEDRPARPRVERVGDQGRPGRKPHRKGQGQSTADGWTARDGGRSGRPASGGAKPGTGRGASGKGTGGSTRGAPQGGRRGTGQESAGAPGRSGRPGAKPGRRPAGAGAARPGRPAGGNARRRSS